MKPSSKQPDAGHASSGASDAAAATDGTTRHVGRLDIDRLSGGKRLQATELVLDDGRRLLLSYRAVPKWFKYVDKRVVVRGQHYTNPPDVQSVNADHFRVVAIELASGETPYATEPRRLPTPDTVATRAELEAHDGRWVQIFATLKTGRRHPDDSWCDVVATLGDGTEIWSSIYESTFKRVWQPLFGKAVTLIGRARVDRTDATRPLKLVGQVAVCPGRAERCGMDQDVQTRNRGPIKIR